MNQNFENLQSLIDILTGDKNIHICIHDISGITDIKQLNISEKNKAHTKAFCDVAKSTLFGYRLCVSCKMLANKKAIDSKALFYGYCPYGLYEVARPVIIDNKTQCIIYIGNFTLDLDKTKNIMQKTCKITKVLMDKLLLTAKDIEIVKSEDFYIQLANIIDSYIRFLYEKYKLKKSNDKKHWIVSTLQTYIENNFNQNITLKEISNLYFFNEKYAGRLFKKQMKLTFHQYLNDIRLKKAIDLLLHTDENIINIAYNCGFQNVTYFNRVFNNRYKMSPSLYKKMRI